MNGKSIIIIILLIILVVITIVAATDVYFNLMGSDDNASKPQERGKQQVERSKQADREKMQSLAARGCYIGEDVGETILWRCPPD